MAQGIFRREELLLGADMMEVIASKRVIIFGVGGVGSWCAESLVRSGVMQLTIVDSDRVCLTNINRQLMATMKTGLLVFSWEKIRNTPLICIISIRKY